MKKRRLISLTVTERGVSLWGLEDEELRELLKELEKLGVEARVIIRSLCG